MIDFILNILRSIYNLLPDSFIQSAGLISSEDMELIANYLNYLNWFIPFDIASKIMTGWLLCVLSYYVGGTVKKIIDKLLDMFFSQS